MTEQRALSAEDLLTLRAAQLARTNPEGWRLLMEALQGFSNNITQYCIQSPLDQLPTAQGRAQAVARVHDLMAGCLTRADKIEGKNK